jgi:membrane-associated phospholipid phosphatase
MTLAQFTHKHQCLRKLHLAMTIERKLVHRTALKGPSFCALIALLAGGPRVAAGQFRADSTRRQLERLVGDVWSNWTAPAHTTGEDALGVVAVAGLTGAAAMADEPLQNWINNNPNALPVALLRPLRESARYPAYELGSGQFLLPISAALYIAGTVSKSQGVRDAGLGCATAHLTAAGVRGLVFLFLQRERPRTSPDDPFQIHLGGTRDWNKHSFFSGHIANSMGCASFLAHRFDLGVAEPVIYGYVIAIGAGRVADGRHWLSDTVFGALFGYAVGRAISTRMLERERGASSPSSGSAPVMVSFSVPF